MNQDLVTLLLAVVAGYAFGSVPAVFLFVKARTGVDLRQAGSGNVGLSNAIQQAGLGIAGPIIAYEVFVKGALPVFLASRFVLDLGMSVQVAVGLAVLAGHNWPIFLGFRGGRGLAPSIGVLLALNPLLLVAYGAVAAGLWLFTRSSPVAWLISMFALPGWVVAFRLPGELFIFVGVYTAIIIFRRSLGNWPGPQVERVFAANNGRILLNRIILDRDVASRDEWLKRRPRAQSGEEVERP
ncbi:MAG: hypothetical protein FJ314_06155 [SAR202 cluster bacterium]|nr:hypothetical protein [SAR202 cluster bacterium]